MAMTVPYQGSPQQTLEPTPTPEMQPKIPQAAFGGTVAEAISTLGTAVSGAGNELFARAISLQALNNETEARKADADYMIKAGTLHAQYSSLEGKAAVDAFPKYQSDLEDARKSTRDGLSNPMSQKMFDSTSLGTLGRSIFNGAGHAAASQKQYVVGTAQSQMAVDAKAVEDNPTDEMTVKRGIANIHTNVASVSAAKGWGDNSPQEKELLLNQTSLFWSQRLTGLAKSDPMKAKELLDEHKTEMNLQSFQKAEFEVKNGLAKNIAIRTNSDLYSPDSMVEGRPEVGLADRTKAARDTARSLYPDDEQFQETVADKVRASFTKRKMDIRDTEAANLNTVSAAINGDFGGKALPTTMEELRATSPEVSAAVDALPNKRKQTILKALANNAEGDVPMTETTFRRFNELRGMSQSTDAKERDQFFDTDLMNEKLPRSQRSALIKRRESMIRQMGEDPAVTRSMTVLRDAGITPDASDKVSTNQFRGALQGALETFSEENKGRKPTPEELKAIGSRLNQEQADPNKYSFGILNRTTPLYQQEVPADSLEKIQGEMKTQGVTMTDEEIRRRYLRESYIRLYGTKPRSQ